jgi:hypothetical protein
VTLPAMDHRPPRMPLPLAVLMVSALVLTMSFDPGAGAGAVAARRDTGSTSVDLTATIASNGSSKGPRPSAKPGHTPSPTTNATNAPTVPPTATPTSVPTLPPTAPPTVPPTAAPTVNPTVAPTVDPTVAPTSNPTPAPTANPAPCPMFPSTNVWNKRIDSLPVRSDSSTMISAIGLTSVLHPDFSSLAWNNGLGYGIPYNKVNLSTPTYHVTFQYASESDPGPYPIPSNPKVEGGSDAHLLAWDTEGCNLYEIFDASYSSGAWHGGSGAIWDLRSNALRPDGWTSADAAGLPILPGLVRYDEVAAGAILHALRFTAPKSCPDHIYPARHDAGSYSCASYPPMGLRVRLKASVDISGYPAQAQVILVALKRYGMLLADNGSPWYVTGAPNAGWDDDALHTLQQLHGSDFEAVDTSSLKNG